MVIIILPFSVSLAACGQLNPPSGTEKRPPSYRELTRRLLFSSFFKQSHVTQEDSLLHWISQKKGEREREIQTNMIPHWKQGFVSNHVPDSMPLLHFKATSTRGTIQKGSSRGKRCWTLLSNFHAFKVATNVLRVLFFDYGVKSHFCTQ